MICPFCEKTIGDDYVVCPICGERLPLKTPSVHVEKAKDEDIIAEELDLSKAFVDGKPLNRRSGGIDELFKIFSGGSFFGGLFDDDIFSDSIFGGSLFDGGLFGSSLFEELTAEDESDEQDEKPVVHDLEQSADGTFHKSKKKRH